MADSNASKDSLSGLDILDGKIASSTVLHDVHAMLVRNIWAAWKEAWVLHKDRPPGSLDQVKFTRVSVVSLTQVAATCAIDVGMTEEQFLATCKANFTEAFGRAPRWA